MFRKIHRIFKTLSYVTPTQLRYRVKYVLRPVQSLELKSHTQYQPDPIETLPIPASKKIIEQTDAGYKVTLLNLSKNYQKQIDWSDDSYGQLWNYHLQYADFLKQEDLTVNLREKLLLDLYDSLVSGHLKPEPYPSSLRIMNLVRFLSENQGILNQEKKLMDYLCSELFFLEERLEYHLLGNHLLENAFALLMGGRYLHNQRWVDLSEKIFSEQIPEQILDDGGHFERSPMYHLIMLFRFLEAVYYLPKKSSLYSLFIDISEKMLAWIDRMSFRNGDIAHFNDSTDNQSYSRKEILEMAKKCGITDYSTSTLSNSGYRRFEDKNFEILVDACGIKPAYQPAHSHADSLSFIFYFHGKPIIIDPGVSTYEDNERRNWERSTEAHNTVTYLKQNTADVWGKFRVGNRPYVEILNESNSDIDIQLTNTLNSGDVFEHSRRYYTDQNTIQITDKVNLGKPVEGRLHFHPSIKIQELTGNTVILEGGIKIAFQNILQLQKFTYKCSNAFNLCTDSMGIQYEFEKKATLRIILPST